MANSTPVVLSCADTPLAIASSTTGFITTLIALALAYYAFFNVFLSAPEAYQDFINDLDTFHAQAASLIAEFGELNEELLGRVINASDFRSLMKLFDHEAKRIEKQAGKIRKEVHDGNLSRTFSMGTHPVKGDTSTKGEPLRSDDERAVKKRFGSKLSIATIRLGVLWWLQLRDKVNEVRAGIASQRAQMSFLYVENPTPTLFFYALWTLN